MIIEENVILVIGNKAKFFLSIFNLADICIFMYLCPAKLRKGTVLRIRKNLPRLPVPHSRDPNIHGIIIKSTQTHGLWVRRKHSKKMGILTNDVTTT